MTQWPKTVQMVVWDFLGTDDPVEVQEWFQALQALARAGTLIHVEQKDGGGFTLSSTNVHA